MGGFKAGCKDVEGIYRAFQDQETRLPESPPEAWEERDRRAYEFPKAAVQPNPAQLVMELTW